MSRDATLTARNIATEALIGLLLPFAPWAYGAVEPGSGAVRQAAVGASIVLGVGRGTVAGLLFLPHRSAAAPPAEFACVCPEHLVALPRARRAPAREGFRALRNVSVSVRRGEVLCAAGPNGGGDSARLKPVTSMEDP